jgi:hypothetical protein
VSAALQATIGLGEVPPLETINYNATFGGIYAKPTVVRRFFGTNFKIMAILSQGKGVMMWLKKRSHSEHFANFLFKTFNKETKISLHKISYHRCDSKNFQRFTTWYGLQNISELLKEFQLEKEVKK